MFLTSDVFEWFQSMNIDSYHVFMYPNVYGMSQYSAGPIMMTRPYFSSSNYIFKMSGYKKSSKSLKYPEILIKGVSYRWYEIWDAVYYNFISENLAEFKKNYATSPQAKHWTNNKSKKEQTEIKKLADAYFKMYFKKR